ncbi:MAG: hypothetical protein ABIL09_13860, partial [Gemmatimonadota bacterium]
MKTRLTSTSIVAALVTATLFGCGDQEAVDALRADLQSANIAVDSLTVALETTSAVLGDLRLRADSLQQVDEQLLASVQELGRQVRHWQQVAAEQQQRNREMATELERMERERATDERTIVRLRTEADSMNAALLTAHGRVQRQGAYIRDLQARLNQAQGEVAEMQRARSSVRLYLGREQELIDRGYLESSRPLTRGFRQVARLKSRINPDDSSLQAADMAGLGEPVTLTSVP